MKSTTSLESRLNVLYTTGMQRLNQEQLAFALEDFQQVLAIAQETDQPQYQIDALYQIGTIHFQLKHHAWSIHCLKQALKIAKPHPVLAQVAPIYNQIGRVYCASGQYSQALRYSAQALEHFLKLSDFNGIAITLNDLGEIYNHLGLFEQTLQCCRKALVIFQDLPETSPAQNEDTQKYEASILHNLGVAEFKLGRFRQALAFLTQALTLRQKNCQSCFSIAGTSTCIPKDSQKCGETAATLTQLGTVHLTLGESKKALDAYQKAAKIYQINGKIEEQAKLINLIGLVCYKNNQISHALWYHLTAIELFNKVKKIENQEENLPHILTIYQQFNLTDEGVKVFHRVQELSHLMGSEVG